MSFSKTHRESSPPDEENPYWVSFSDIMAGLLVIFILASMALVLQLQDKNEQVTQAIKEFQQAEKVRRTIVEEIVLDLEKADIEVFVSENHTVIHIPENVISFEQGRYDLPRDQNIQSNALKIGEALGRAIRKDERWKYLDTVFVEGHTDNLPCPKRLCPMGNWGLSANRAIAVWRYWDETLDELSKLEPISNHVGDRLFSVSGYAETRPEASTIGKESTRDGRAKNRRIDIRFTIRRPKIGDLKDIKAKF